MLKELEVVSWVIKLSVIKTTRKNSYTWHEKMLFHYTISHKEFSLTRFYPQASAICIDSFTIILRIDFFLIAHLSQCLFRDSTNRVSERCEREKLQQYEVRSKHKYKLQTLRYSFTPLLVRIMGWSGWIAVQKNIFNIKVFSYVVNKLIK